MMGIMGDRFMTAGPAVAATEVVMGTGTITLVKRINRAAQSCKHAAPINVIEDINHDHLLVITSIV